MDGEDDSTPSQTLDIDDSDFMLKFQCMGTSDREVLITEFQRLLAPATLGPEGCAFFLEMNNWNLQQAICSYFDFDAPKDYLNQKSLPTMTLMKDVTIGEGEEIPPNTKFVKTWRIQNTGPDSWPVGCCLRFLSGHQLTNFDRIHVDPLIPGQTCDVSIEMCSPSAPGYYEGQWRMATPSGLFFGVAEGGLLGLTQQMNSSFHSLGSSPAGPNGPCNNRLQAPNLSSNNCFGMSPANNPFSPNVSNVTTSPQFPGTTSSLLRDSLQNGITRGPQNSHNHHPYPRFGNPESHSTYGMSEEMQDSVPRIPRPTFTPSTSSSNISIEGNVNNHVGDSGASTSGSPASLYLNGAGNLVIHNHSIDRLKSTPADDNQENCFKICNDVLSRSPVLNSNSPVGCGPGSDGVRRGSVTRNLFFPSTSPKANNSPSGHQVSPASSHETSSTSHHNYTSGVASGSSSSSQNNGNNSSGVQTSGASGFPPTPPSEDMML